MSDSDDVLEQNQRLPTQNLRYLCEHGPTPIADLPHPNISVTDRQEGVWKFKPNHRTLGSGAPKHRYGVAYLHDEHSVESVVETWLTANAAVVEELSRNRVRRLLRSAGPAFYDAIDVVYPRTPIEEVTDE